MHSRVGLGRFRDSVVTLQHSLGEATDASMQSTPQLKSHEQRLIDSWNDTAHDVPTAAGGAGLQHLIEAQVDRTPHAVAVVLDDCEWSYAELDLRANALAHRLLALGVGRQALVGVFMERSFDMVVSMLAIWKAGGVYLPLEPDFPRQRLHDTVADSAAAVVITTAALCDRLPLGAPQLCLLADGAGGPQALSTTRPAVVTKRDDACYVIYTSGSTGVPKGALLPHRAICNHMAWMVAHYRLGADDHVLQKTPFSFDASVWEFLAPLLTGARLVMARPGGHRDMPYLARTIVRHQVATLQLVPSVLQLLVDESGFTACTSLRRVYCGGEALTTALVRRFAAKLPGTQLHNLYGPTECCIDTTAHACRVDTEGAVQPIGRPIWNTTHHVLDERQQPVAIGVAGELYIGGAGLALGYLNREALSAEKFVTLSLGAASPPRRLYRTGDRVRLVPSGLYEFLGRIDFQVKLNGFRIELGEIEAVLETHPLVRQAVAMLREDQPGHKLLVAYVMPAVGAEPTPAELRAHMSLALPSHMLPSLCVVLPSLPLTGNGKVDRRALPNPERQDAATAASRAGAAGAGQRTDTETQLFEIWAEVLATRAFDIDDDYFSLGGSSLGLMEIGLAVRSRLQVGVEPERLFEATTVRAQARWVDAARAAPAVAATDAHEATAARTVLLAASGLPEAQPVPASFEQLAFWRAAHALRRWPLSNTSEVVGLGSQADLAALQRAVNAVVARHHALRTVLWRRGGQLWQQVLPAAAVAIERVDLEAAGLAATVARIVQRPLDLEHGPLSRWLLLSATETAAETAIEAAIEAAPEVTTKTSHWLVLVVHHAMTDAQSTETLVQDLLRFYEAALHGRELDAPPLALRYGDYADWQHRRLQAGEFEAARRQWAQLLARAPAAVRLPGDRPRRAVPRWQGGRETLLLDADLRSALKAVAATRKVTLYMVLLAALDVLLWQISGQTDLVVGSSLAGRPDARLHEVVGCFIGALPLRVRLQGDLTWAALLERVRQVCLQAYALQDLPLGKALETLTPGAGYGGGALLPVWLELHDRRQGWESRFAHLGVRRHDIDRGICESELSLEIEDSGATLVCHAQYKSELFGAERVQAWLLRYRQLLQALVDAVDGPLPLAPGAATDPSTRACR